MVENLSRKEQKRKNKQTYRDYLIKQAHDGYVYPNCPICWQNKKVSTCVYGSDGYFTCDVCNEKWTVVA